MKKLTYIFILVMIISLSGCVKILNDDLKKKETKMVLNAAISPDSIYTVNISRTFNIFENESATNLPFIDSATVRLFDNDGYLFNLEYIGSGYYIKPGYYPEVGKEYTVKVAYGSLEPIEGKTVIPNAVPITDFDTVMVHDYEFYDSHTKYVGVLKYHDPAGVENRYQLKCKVSYKDANGEEYFNDQAIRSLESDDRFFDGNYGGILLWSDKLTDGKDVTVRFVFYDAYEYEQKSDRASDTIRFVFSLQSVNKAYYTYLKSVGIYWESGGSDNPFSEPVVIYSNIDNGYGIFGGYNQDTVTANIVYENGIGKGGDR